MLTKNQKEVLDYVRSYTTKHEFAPSLDEIRKHFKLASVSTAHHYLKKLEEGKYLAREANQPRGMSVLAGDFMGSPIMGNIIGFEYISIPLVGSANCGPAEILAEENIEGYLTVQRSMVPKKSGIFALRAVGKSLNRANIKGKTIDEGDLVLVDFEDRDAKNGDYILSIIDGAANLKKYKKDKKTGQVTLVSETTEPWKPIFMLPGDDWAVNGKIVGVLKGDLGRARK
ncbi:MAG: transcriptional repressor LexA [bacterium]|nr:transcriptional repressor LexA [bacterium]